VSRGEREVREDLAADLGVDHGREQELDPRATVLRPLLVGEAEGRERPLTEPRLIDEARDLIERSGSVAWP